QWAHASRSHGVESVGGARCPQRAFPCLAQTSALRATRSTSMHPDSTGTPAAATLRDARAGEPATHTRHWLLVFASTLAIITFIDRVCLSQTKLAIVGDLKLSDQEMGFVFSAFGLAYALFEIPGGWLGDR